MQDALVKLLRYADFTQLQGVDDLVRYFSTVVHRSVLDVVAHRGPLSSSAEPSAEGDVEENATADVQDGPEQLFAGRRALEALYEALRPRERMVVALLTAGYDRGEIADRLGLSERTAAVLIHRVRNRVRDISQHS